MATTTNHLGLTLPAGTEPVSLQVLNDNWRKVEAGILKALRGKAAHNLLDNSDFRHPVNQRGLTSYTTIGYTIDRWRTWADVTVTVGNGYIKKDNVGPLYQYIDPAYINTGVGNTYTIALQTASRLYVYSGNFIQGFGEWDKTIMALCDANGMPLVRIEIAITEELLWCALYEGAYTADTLPDYAPKGYAAELAECQRYYYQSWGGTSKNLTGIIAVPAMTASRLQPVALPQTMRVTPTVTLYSTNNGTADSVQEWVTDALVSGVTAIFASKTRFGAASDGGFELGKYYYYHYAASADL